MLLLMSFVIYLLLGLMPGDPIDIMASGDPDMTTADVARLKSLYGLDQPLTARYWHWLTDAVSGNFGFSRIHSRPVLEVLGPRLWNTTVLMGVSFVLALAIAIPAGVIAAVHPRTWIDYVINLIAFAGFSLPSFWLALLLILLFSVQLGWLPAGGVQSVGRDDWADWLLHLIMPVDRPDRSHHGPRHPFYPRLPCSKPCVRTTSEPPKPKASAPTAWWSATRCRTR